MTEPVVETVCITTLVTRLALRPEEAAASIGVSLDFWAKHCAPEIRTVERGRLKLYSVRAIEKWLEESSARPLQGA